MPTEPAVFFSFSLKDTM